MVRDEDTTVTNHKGDCVLTTMIDKIAETGRGHQVQKRHRFGGMSGGRPLLHEPGARDILEGSEEKKYRLIAG